MEPLREDSKRNRYNLKHSTFGSLYKGSKDKVFFLYPISDQKWMIEEDQRKMEQTFTSFDEGESFLKRNYAAWLGRDDTLVSHLMENFKRNDEKGNPEK